MGQRQPVPLVFVSWVNAPTLGPIVQRTETLILYVLIYEYPELAYLCESPAAGLTLLLDWVGGAGG